MTDGELWREVNFGADGRAHVRVHDPVVGVVTVVMPGFQVDSEAGAEIIRRALAARRAAHDVVHGEGS